MPREHRLKVLIAFAAIYLIWGSTYLAIRYAIATIPPYLMACARYATAGVVMVAWARASGAAWPTRREWGIAFVAGTLLLAGGNGGLSWAEQRVPSGLAALILASIPLVTVLVDWLRPRGKRPEAVTGLGLALGFAGVALLISPAASDAARVDPAGAAVLLAATLSWSIGTVYSRQVHGAPSPLMGSGASMLAGSASLLLVAAALGEPARLQLTEVTGRSLMGLAYLVVFGSVVGFTAYFWLLRHVAPAKVTTYAYVNPVVALLLGWGIEGEPVTSRVVLAAAVILGGVVVATAVPHARAWFAARRPGSLAAPAD